MSLWNEELGCSSSHSPGGVPGKDWKSFSASSDELHDSSDVVSPSSLIAKGALVLVGGALVLVVFVGSLEPLRILESHGSNDAENVRTGLYSGSSVAEGTESSGSRGRLVDRVRREGLGGDSKHQIGTC